MYALYLLLAEESEEEKEKKKLKAKAREEFFAAIKMEGVLCQIFVISFNPNCHSLMGLGVNLCISESESIHHLNVLVTLSSTKKQKFYIFNLEQIPI